MRHTWQSIMPKTVAIAGLGLIGGSLALRLVQHGIRVVAWNHRPDPYSRAQADGIETVASVEELVHAHPDVLVLCTPLVVIEQVCEQLAPVWDSSITLTDVGSVKRQVRESVVRAGLGDSYIGAHPMAGNEHSGFDAAYAGLLDDALWAITIDERSSLTRVQQLLALIVGALENRAIVLDDTTHDRAASLISHMPHVVATELVNVMQSSPLRSVAQALAAGSWRDMTRVALTDPERTRAMVEEDGDTVAPLLRQIAGDLLVMAQALEQGETSASREFFGFAQPYRDFRHASARDTSSDTAELLTLYPEHWQHDMLTLTPAGKQITGLVEDSQALSSALQLRIESRTAW